jgi:hypothetical protein
MEGLHVQGRDDLVHWLLDSWVRCCAALRLTLLPAMRATCETFRALRVCVTLALIRFALCDCLESTRYSCPRRRIRSSVFHSLLQHYNPLTGQGYGAKGYGMSTLVCDWLQRVR